MSPTNNAPGAEIPGDDRGGRGRFAALLLCLLLSGASGLVYEVAWVRTLELIFGSTSFAVATVLASFMGGLALGSWWMGTRLHRLARFRPLRVYAALEVLLAVAGLAVPLVLRLQTPLYRLLAGGLVESFLGQSVVRLLLCLAVLLVPTAIMGATLPAVSAVVGGDNGSGRRIGLLYAVNTLGAVLGCAGAGLVLMPALGLARTQWVAVALNAAAAGGALLIARVGAAARERTDEAAGDAAAAGGPSGAPAGRDLGRLLILAYAFSGFTAMLYEVAWSRLLVLVLGSSTYAYTIMLATFLLGIALGAGLGVRLTRRVADPLLPAVLCQSAVAGATYLGLFLVQELPYLYHLIYDRVRPSPAGLLGVQWLLAASLMIAPTIGLGAMFPITVRGLNPAGGRASRAVGRAYAWNTVGAIAGSLLAGFWLIPGAGTRLALIAGILINTALAVGLALARGGLRAPRPRLVLAAALAVFAVNAVVAAPRWKPEVLSSGMFRYVDRYRGLDREGFLRRARQSHGEILMFEEGLTCTVTVFRTPALLTLAIDGKPDASVPSGLSDPLSAAVPRPGGGVTPGGGATPGGDVTPGGDLATQVLVAQIPLLLAPAAGEVLVIGLGSGVSLGSVLTHPVRAADAVELEAAVVRSSRFFEPQNGRPLGDPRVRLIVNDARGRLLLSGRRYDVIVSEPSNPWLAGSAGLFTREFFDLARTRLTPGGVFAQWVQMYELRTEDFLAIVRSFTGVFPEVHLFRVNEDAILLGSGRPLPIDLARIVTRGSPRVRADLARAGVVVPEDLLGHYWAGGEELAGAIPPGPINTDDNMLIEFAAPLRMLTRDPERLRAQTVALAGLFSGRANGLAGRMIFPAEDGDAESAFWARTAIAALARGGAEPALVYAGRSLALRRNAMAAAAYGEGLARLGREAEAAAWWLGAGREFPRDPEIRRALARLHAGRGDWARARAHAGELVRLAPADREGRLLLARAAQALDDPRGVIAAIGPSAVASGSAAGRDVTAGPGAPPAGAAGAGAAGAGPAWPETEALLGWAYHRLGRHAAAVEPLRRHLAARPRDAGTRRVLADALERTGKSAEAAAVARPLEPDAAGRAAGLFETGRRAWESGDRAGARASLEEAFEFDPTSDVVAFALARARARDGDREAAIGLVREFLAGHPDHPWAVGYLAELLERAGRRPQARLLAARYVALTGRPWRPIDDHPGR
jgi:spermidine synthase